MEIQFKAWKLISSLETSGLERVGTGLEEKALKDGKVGNSFSSEELREADPCKGYGAGQCPEEAGTQITARSAFSTGPQPL